MKKGKRVFFLLGVIFFITQGAQAGEKSFPARQIQVIIPFQPGETDSLLRPFIDKLPEYLGQPVTLVYKPGAAGGVGAGFVAASKPDGYILLGSSQSSVSLLPLSNKELTYTNESFVPVTCLVEGYLLLVVQANARWKNIQEFVAESRNHPGKLSYASTGTFGIGHIAGEAFCNAAGIKLTHIPAQGSGPAVTAVLGGHVDVAVTGSGPSVPHIKAGALRALGVFNEKRVRALPDVPSCHEAGSSVILPLKYGLLAPRGTPKAVVDRLHEAAKKMIEKNQRLLEDRLQTLGAQIGFIGPEDYRDFLKAQNQYFDTILKRSRLITN